MGNVKPITPEGAGIKKIETLPDFVIQAFNDTIVKNLANNYSSFKVMEVSDHMRDLATSSGMNAIEFDKRAEKEHWYDVEPFYQAAGWKVKYDSPDRDSSFDPYFIFSKK